MGAGHSHGGPPPQVPLSRLASRFSVGLLIAAAVATLIGLVAFWPGPRLDASAGYAGQAASVAPIVRGEITELAPCEGVPTDLASVQHTCQVATVAVVQK